MKKRDELVLIFEFGMIVQLTYPPGSSTMLLTSDKSPTMEFTQVIIWPGIGGYPRGLEYCGCVGERIP